MNKVVITGKVVNDINIIEKGDLTIAKGTVCVRKKKKRDDNSKPEDIFDFFDFTAFNNPANYIAKYVNKGDRVELLGSIAVNRYKNNDGITVRIYYIVVDEITAFANIEDKENIEFANSQIRKSDLPIEIEEDDLPF